MLGVWSFGAMVAIAAVLALAALIEETWPGLLTAKTAPNAPQQAESERLTLLELTREHSRRT